MERWYLLITEKFLFWTFWWWEIRSFFSQEVDGKNGIYWLQKSSCFELFGGGKYGLFWVKKLVERECLLVNEKILFWTFQWWEIRSFYLPKSWWKDDIYLVFLIFPWYSRTWEISFFVQCGKKNFKLIFIVFIDHKVTCRKAEELHILNGIYTLDTWSVFCEKSSLPSFLPCSTNFSRCSFVIFFTLALAWFLISALSLRYFFTSCSTLWNSVGKISPSCIFCEMILAMLTCFGQAVW